MWEVKTPWRSSRLLALQPVEVASREGREGFPHQGPRLEVPLQFPPRIDGIAPSSWSPSRAVKNQHQPDRALRHGRWLACAVMSRSTLTGHLPNNGKQPAAHTDNDLRAVGLGASISFVLALARCVLTPGDSGVDRRRPENVSREAPPPSCACNAKCLGRVKDQLKPIRADSSRPREWTSRVRRQGRRYQLRADAGTAGAYRRYEGDQSQRLLLLQCAGRRRQVQIDLVPL
jgi:hypothetical protein